MLTDRASYPQYTPGQKRCLALRDHRGWSFALADGSFAFAGTTRNAQGQEHRTDYREELCHIATQLVLEQTHPI